MDIKTNYNILSDNNLVLPSRETYALDCSTAPAPTVEPEPATKPALPDYDPEPPQRAPIKPATVPGPGHQPCPSPDPSTCPMP